MALQVGQQKCRGCATQTLPGLADGTLREFGTSQNARYHRQRPHSNALQAIQSILYRQTVTVFGSAAIITV